MTCETCKHFVPAPALSGAPLGVGNCHRYPPQIFVAPVNIPGRGAVMHPAAGFPQVQGSMSCGEWGARKLMND